MKYCYINTFLVISIFITLTSCNKKYHFVTKGLTEIDSSYTVNNLGERFNAKEIIVRKNNVIVDGRGVKLSELSVVKSKKMYFFIKDESIYVCEIYGKINLLYNIFYSSTYTSGSGSFGAGGGSYKNTAQRVYYLQRERTNIVDELNKSVLLKYLSGNEAAVNTAKGAYLWTYAHFASTAGLAGSAVWTGISAGKIKSGAPSSSIIAPLTIIGIFGTAYVITHVVSDHKINKSILIYNSSN